jgi:membrane fusion protein, heavy metal efflux system
MYSVRNTPMRLLTVLLSLIFAAQSAGAGTSAAEPASAAAVVLSASQLAKIGIEPVSERPFPQEVHAVGTIDFNQELLTQVFTPYQGRIIKTFASVGDVVRKDQILFTVDSPDLVQAESTLIATEGVRQLTSRILERQRSLYRQSAAAQKDYEQAVSDQQTAEANYKAARDSVRIFGKTDAEIDKVVKDRKIDPALVINAPIAGLITERDAAPGLFVQPGNPPPVYTIADTSTMWMLANVPDRDASAIKDGQEVKATVSYLPGQLFKGKVINVGDIVDPSTRRVLVRSEIANPKGELRAGMFANFAITIAPPKRALAIPEAAAVREGDGTHITWVTADRKSFTKRTIVTGAVHDGYAEVKDGLSAGELVARDTPVLNAAQYK